MDETRWTVRVERSACLGTGVCASVFPTRFAISGGKSRALREDNDPDEELLDAADLCPMGAIRVTDRATGVSVLPEED
ncbi:ferredoxin [Streptomyces sp. NBC_00102]|uniref:ferredoxin n=1 Tax=Streptomyces sp. NBC_00102 TaxID=2975652 RepID=UPI00224EE217|nr:ferredoxin [Streptomyces sp. NBC_00102]MCX5399881.1 ferredoxin [Streptomyces sp. NBC_00102]